ncbi:MAG: hypothetical protein WD885_02505, partial [Candidatus Saccharimonadales bacterium]
RRGFNPEESESFADYREMIRHTANVADEETEKAGYKLGLSAGAGIGSVLLGVEVSPVVGAIAAIPTVALTQSGIKNALGAIRSGNSTSTLQALHHHEKYERNLAKEKQAQNKAKSSGQSE